MKYVEFDLLPSMDSKLSIKDISVPKIKEKLYSGMVSNGHSHDWSVYSNESKSIFNNTLHTENLESNTLNLEKVKDTQKKNSAPGFSQPVNKKKGIYRFISPTIIETSKKAAKDVGKNLKKAGVATLKFATENPEVVAAVVVAVAELMDNSNTQNLIASDDYIDSHDGNRDSHYEDEYYYEAENLSTSETPFSVVDKKGIDDVNEEAVSLTNDFPNKREVHASKHIRKLPNGQKASPEKVATAKENGIDLQPGETWVKDY